MVWLSYFRGWWVAQQYGESSWPRSTLLWGMQMKSFWWSWEPGPGPGFWGRFQAVGIAWLCASNLIGNNCCNQQSLAMFGTYVSYVSKRIVRPNMCQRWDPTNVFRLKNAGLEQWISWALFEVIDHHWTVQNHPKIWLKRVVMGTFW